jgi:hypothetical protein
MLRIRRGLLKKNYPGKGRYGSEGMFQKTASWMGEGGFG